MTARTNYPTLSADEAVEILTLEGYPRADVLATVDSVIAAGVESDNRLTDADVQTCHDQLDDADDEAHKGDMRFAEVERVAGALGVPVSVLLRLTEGYWRRGRVQLPQARRAPRRAAGGRGTALDRSTQQTASAPTPGQMPLSSHRYTQLRKGTSNPGRIAPSGGERQAGGPMTRVSRAITAQLARARTRNTPRVAPLPVVGLQLAGFAARMTSAARSMSNPSSATTASTQARA